MTKRILVFGATGQQGSATTRQLLAHGFTVRAFTRQLESDSTIALQQAGAELFKGNLDDEATIIAAMQDVYGVFLVQPPSWLPTQESDEHEARTGMLVTDIAKKNGVKHLIYSSVLGSELQADFRPLFKFAIEEYIKQSGVPATIFKPASFFENFYMPHFGLPEHRIYNPLPADQSLPFISVEDIGIFARLAFQHPEQYIGKTMDLAGDSFTVETLSTLLSQEFNTAITPVQVPVEMAMQQNILLGKFMEAIHKYGYRDIDLALLRQLHPQLMTAKDWVDTIGRKRLAEVLHVK